MSGKPLTIAAFIAALRADLARLIAQGRTAEALRLMQRAETLAAAPPPRPRWTLAGRREPTGALARAHAARQAHDRL